MIIVLKRISARNLKNTLKLYFTNDDQLISLNAKNGKPIKSFGKNGIIKIGSSPIPPVIIDNKLVIATFRPSIEKLCAERGCKLSN